MTPEEQLQRIKVAAGIGPLRAGAALFGPALGALAGGATGYYTGGVPGAIAGALGGNIIGRGVRGGLRGAAAGRPIFGALEDAGGNRAFRMAGNLMPVAAAGLGGVLGADIAPLGSEGSGLMWGAGLGALAGIGGKTLSNAAYKALRDRMTGGRRRVRYTVTAPDTGKIGLTESSLAARERMKQGSFDPSMGLGYTIPGTPVSLRMDSEKAERLPGMSRWAPRHMIERAFALQEAGVDDGEAIARAEDEGLFTDPLVGAGLGAIAGPAILPGAEAKARLIGALAGGAGGLGLNLAGRSRRGEQMAAALRGAAVERDRFPLERQDDSTASSSPPLLLSSGTGVG